MKKRAVTVKKADLILIAVCLLAAAFVAAFGILHREKGAVAQLVYDGIVLRTIALRAGQEEPSDTDDGYYLITYQDDVTAVEYCADRPALDLPEYIDYNLVSVRDGQVTMCAADCRDQICVRHKSVSLAGESIICLPHGLVVEIIGERQAADGAPDGVTR